MKKILKFTVLVFLLGCTNEDIEVFPVKNKESIAVARKDNNGNKTADWDMEAYIVISKYSKKGYCIFSGGNYTSEGFERENISIEDIPLTIGTHKILTSSIPENLNDKIESSYHRSIADGDVEGASYCIRAKKHSFISFTSIDTINKRATGAFELRYTKKKSETKNDFPCKVNFLKGTFDVKILKQ